MSNLSLTVLSLTLLLTRNDFLPEDSYSSCNLTPNHWGDNNVGNKHYLFMLDECKSDVSLRSFHVENLNADLLQHRKVMEVLGTTTMLEPNNNQLCGLGFNSTVGDELILKISGSHKRSIKVRFDGLNTKNKN